MYNLLTPEFPFAKSVIFNHSFMTGQPLVLARWCLWITPIFANTASRILQNLDRSFRQGQKLCQQNVLKYFNSGFKLETALLLSYNVSRLYIQTEVTLLLKTKWNVSVLVLSVQCDSNFSGKYRKIAITTKCCACKLVIRLVHLWQNLCFGYFTLFFFSFVGYQLWIIQVRVFCRYWQMQKKNPCFWVGRGRGAPYFC